VIGPEDVSDAQGKGSAGVWEALPPSGRFKRVDSNTGQRPGPMHSSSRKRARQAFAFYLLNNLRLKRRKENFLLILLDFMPIYG
jgi:hypothetical protein